MLTIVCKICKKEAIIEKIIRKKILGLAGSPEIKETPHLSKFKVKQLIGNVTTFEYSIKCSRCNIVKQIVNVQPTDYILLNFIRLPDWLFGQFGQFDKVTSDLPTVEKEDFKLELPELPILTYPYGYAPEKRGVIDDEERKPKSGTLRLISSENWKK